MSDIAWKKKSNSRWRQRVESAGMLLALLLLVGISQNAWSRLPELSGEEKPLYAVPAVSTNGEEDFIRYVDFTVPLWALEYAYQLDITTYGEATHLPWVTLLAYASAKTGADYGSKSKIESLFLEAKDTLSANDRCLDEWSEDFEYFDYYYEVYDSILGGLLGEYEYEEDNEWKSRYGLKAFNPVARYFYYEDYDDFGASRSYGYRRRHLGHDMLGQTGTPIIAVESGVVEALGWNQYGGWRIGIRSFDGRRYYYYAHLRKNWPYVKSLKEGDVVTAGDVIGYMGRTGYSATENTNNIETTHLHFGLQLVFDESQKESDNEIWIDVYALTQFLLKHRQETLKNQETGEWGRINDIRDPAELSFLENALQPR